METKWQDISTAPTDGTRFLSLIGGIPYMAKMQDGRFIWYMHTDVGSGPTYQIHDVNGKRMLEKVAECKAMLVPNGIIWRDGFSDLPTHWMPLEPIPDEARRTPTAQELIQAIAKHPPAIRKEGSK